MSYILQALARSEKERRQKDAPDLEDAFATAEIEESTRSFFGLAVILIIGGTVAVTLYMSSLFTTENTESAALTPIENPVEIAPTPVLATNSNPVEVTPPTPESEDGTEKSNTSPSTEITVAEPESSPAITEIAIIEPPVEQVNSLPGIELNIHIFSDDPSKRFVYINGKRHGEGESIRENDGFIREITADGVIIDFGERRVLLNRIR